MPKKWDVDDAITQAIIDGVPTKKILLGIRGGTLPNLGRAQALPERTFYQSLDRCRRRLGALSPAQSADPLARLRAKLEAEGAEEAKPDAETAPNRSGSMAPSDSDALPITTPDVVGRRDVESVVAEIRRLAESEGLESLPGARPGSAR